MPTLARRHFAHRVDVGATNWLDVGNVFIENDLPLQQRIVNNNNRILLKALGKENDYIIKSGRVLKDK
jgi:hypothetical protein